MGVVRGDQGVKQITSQQGEGQIKMKPCTNPSGLCGISWPKASLVRPSTAVYFKRLIMLTHFYT